MSRTSLRRVARLEEAPAAPPAANLFSVVDRGSSPEAQAEGDARVEELFASGQVENRPCS